MTPLGKKALVSLSLAALILTVPTTGHTRFQQKQ